MPKIKVHSVDKREKYRITSELFEVIISLKSKREVFGFLFGLLTPSEILMIARRLQIAKMLSEEKGYNAISKKLGVSHQTINKVEQWLHGDEERNELIENKINKIKKKRKNDKRNYNSSMLDKYAHHRFLKDLLG